MAVMDFGSFLQGLRLSEQDIADRRKMALNEEYMRSQMETMDLGRDYTRLRMRGDEDEINYRPTLRARDTLAFQREYDSDRLLGAFEDPNADPLVAYNEANRALSSTRREAGLSPYEEVREVVVKGSDGKEVTGWQWFNEGGQPTTRVITDRRTAVRVGAEKLGGTPGWAKEEADARRARMYSGGGTGSKYKEAPAFRAVRDSLSAVNKELGQIEANFANKAVMPADVKARAAQLQREKLALELMQQDYLARGWDVYDERGEDPTRGRPGLQYYLRQADKQLGEAEGALSRKPGRGNSVTGQTLTRGKDGKTVAKPTNEVISVDDYEALYPD